MSERIRELNRRFKTLAPATEAELRDEIEKLQARVAELEAESLQSVANKVCGELPEGWVVNLCMENGAAWVEVIKTSGYTIEIDGADMTLAGQIDEAMAAAASPPTEGSE